MKKIIFTTLFTSILILTSCTNLFQDKTGSQKQSQSDEDLVTFTGTMESSGALPAQVYNLMSSSNSRSALPNTSDLEYFATATNGTKTIEGTFVEESNPPTFEIGLTPGSTWEITCGLRFSEGSDDDEAREYIEVYKDSYEVEITSVNPVLSHSFHPQPVMDGKGSVRLGIYIDAAISRVSALSSSSYDWNINDEDAPVILSASDIPCGSYEVTLNFYNNNSILLFSTTQTINVLKGIETNIWISDDNNLVNSDGNFEITEEIINDFARRTYYVGSTPASESMEIAPSDDNGSGSVYEPFETLNHAISAVNTVNDGESEYIIYLNASSSSVSICPDSNLNLTIQSLTGSAEDAIIDGGNSQRCINIPSNNAVLNLTLRNLTVQNGSLSGVNGAGILIGVIPNDSIINLNNCLITENNLTEGYGAALAVNYPAAPTINITNTSISNNTIIHTGYVGSYSGAGIFIENTETKLNIKGSSIISNNVIDSANFSGTPEDSGAGLYLGNKATTSISGNVQITGNCFILPSSNSSAICYGAGIYSKGGELKISGSCQITGNKAPNGYGGGIYNEGDLFIYGNVVIGDNTQSSYATSTSYSNTAAYGAGIYNTGNLNLGYSDNETTSTYSGGIYYNYASTNGGGIYIKAGSLNINSGNISYNSSANNGGGILFEDDDTPSTNLISGGIIEGNKATNGAGIYTESDITMTGGTIKGNEGNTSGNGGGIFVNKGKQFIMSGDSKILDNKNMNYGAGVYLNYDNCKLVMKGGEISGNIAETHGGAVYMHDLNSSIHSDMQISGSSYIPYGGAVNNNDIFMLDFNAKITITGSLSDRQADNLIYITPKENSQNTYTEGKTILEADSGVSLTDEFSKFRVTPDSQGKEWSIDTNGNLSSLIYAYITEETLANFSPSSSTAYIIIVDSSFGNTEVQSLLSKIKSRVGEGTILDLGNSTATSIATSSSYWLTSGVSSITLPATLSSSLGCQFFQGADTLT